MYKKLPHRCWVSKAQGDSPPDVAPSHKSKGGHLSEHLFLYEGPLESREKSIPPMRGSWEEPSMAHSISMGRGKTYYVYIIFNIWTGSNVAHLLGGMLEKP